MKNKKLRLRLYCFIACMILFVANCAAKKVEEFWWGKKISLESNEIKEYRLEVSSYLKKILAAHTVTTVGSYFIPAIGPACGTTMSLLTAAEDLSISLLLNTIESWEGKGKAIVIKLPHAIQGWEVYAQ